MTITLTGATGFLGTLLVERLRQDGHEIRILTRSPRTGLASGVRAFLWDASRAEPPEESLDGVDAVIHLAGETVNQRWTAEAKQRIRESRVQSTRLLVQALSTRSQRPATLLSGSAIGIYGQRGNEVVREESSAGDGFLAEVGKEWEREANLARSLGIRVALLRTGVVFHPAGGALGQMLPVFRLGLGGNLGDGQQWMSWIHWEDWVESVVWLLQANTVAGPVNLTAPGAVRNEEFTSALGRVLQRPAFLPVPRFALRTLFGEMAAIILDSQRVEPAVLEKAGYSFRHPTLEAALRKLL